MDKKPCPLHEGVDLVHFSNERNPEGWWSHETYDERFPVKKNGKRYCTGSLPKSNQPASGNVKSTCLDYAIKICSTKPSDEITTEGVLAIAKRFEEYLNG